MFYDRTGNIENCLGRSIILFEPDSLRVWKMFFEVEDVGDVSTAPFVDRLVLVADHANVLLFFRQQTDQGKLKRVCVLILIDQDVTKLVVVLFAHFGNFTEQSHGLDHQIVEVERVVGMQPFLVRTVDAGLCGALFVNVFSARGKRVNILAAVLG